jgi:uncharacterized protein YbgA (DUF1722 family)/uncharacterized protein YbbK (DUF523 family)
MATFARPRIVISRCIDFDACRYNGQAVRASLREELEPHVEFVPVCPELEIGLGVPRDPIRMVDRPGEIGLIQPSTGRDLTAQMTAFSSGFLERERAVDGFILKSRSPSCGIRGVNVYAGIGSEEVARSGAGRFASAVLERFPHTAIEDEGRLNNLRLREHFLTRVFAAASMRGVADEETLSGLLRFHSANKLLLMAYNQVRMRRLGRIVAGAGPEPVPARIARYMAELGPALARPASMSAHVNVLMHVLGHFSDELNRAEKARFLDALESFRRERLPVSALLEVVRSWSARFGNAYLEGQTYLSPFPAGLVRLDARRRRRRPLAA